MTMLGHVRKCSVYTIFELSIVYKDGSEPCAKPIWPLCRGKVTWSEQLLPMKWALFNSCAFFRPAFWQISSYQILIKKMVKVSDICSYFCLFISESCSSLKFSTLNIAYNVTHFLMTTVYVCVCALVLLLEHIMRLPINLFIESDGYTPLCRPLDSLIFGWCFFCGGGSIQSLFTSILNK